MLSKIFKYSYGFFLGIFLGSLVSGNMILYSVGIIGFLLSFGYRWINFDIGGNKINKFEN